MTAPRTGRRARGASAAGALLALTLALAGCAPSAPGSVPGGTAAVQREAADRPAGAGTGAAPARDLAGAAGAAGKTAATSSCGDPTASYAPDGDLPSPADLPAGSTMAKIRERGALRVGVSADTLLMGSRNPLDGEIEGFDIDVLHAVSDAIFGDPDRLQFKVITSDQRIGVLESGEVDLVARAFTITCDRWEQIAFSSVYYRAGQKLLVPRGSGATTFDDLAGKRVCAPEGTTTLASLDAHPGVVPVPAATHTQCLVLFQQGKVDAITGDDTILAGFARQDPYTTVVGDALSDEPYGVGVNKDQVDLVRFVNAVLETMRDDGTWEKSYQRWLGSLGSAQPPRPTYGREP
ncbi:glutamate ABC transporter substrate-binding protein [Cellulomonas sp. PhB143]|uniref:glutamate ABC transporter substrate-binding protein n=1 Tax=Cellulomonas sp. PhB143 TaxID=2485186 RepID=UPI000F49ED91|nr:glutamate ABC transporter substrate-binding protein [Cellulomonas sp. PhB143]ROS77038.1 amino acid ABC transporter substrate-binding protein (PAAT family) [Cellulomonas sp. PhB143]